MSVDIGAVISRAFQTVVRYRVLWVLGFFVALLSGSANGSLNYRVDDQSRFQIFNVEITPTWPWAIALGIGALVVVIAIFLLRSALDAGMIAAGDASARDAPPSLAAAWRAGRSGMWAVLVLNLIFAGFVVVLIATLLLLLGITAGSAVLFGALANQVPLNVPEWLPALGWGVGLGCGLILLAVPVAIVLAVVTQLAQRAAVLDGLSIGAAWRAGWQVMRTNLGAIIAMLLVQLLASLAMGLVTLVVVGVVLGVPVLMLAAQVGTLSAGEVVLLVALALIAWLINAAVYALPRAWNSLLWTLTYRAATVGLPVVAARPAAFGGRLPPTVPGGMGR